MGQQVKYTGDADVREIYKKDFDSVGVTDQDLVRFERSNGFTAEVSEKAAKYLVDNESNFELVGSAKSSSSGDDAKRATSGDKK